MLMLSGVRDEVVPREHMKDLWEIVQKRTLAGQGSETKVEEESKPVHEVHGRGGYSKLVEFEWGTHSECQGVAYGNMTAAMLTFPSDDTCVQPGYWKAVLHFIQSLH